MKHTSVTESQTQPMWLAVYLAVSFHSASSPSLRQISSSSVNKAWGMCSSSPSSVPNRNCTLWAGVSAAANELYKKRQNQPIINSIKCPNIVLLLVLDLTVWGGFSSIFSCGVPLLGPLPVSVSVVTVTSVWPPAQRDMNPNVERAVTWRHQAKGSIRFFCFSFNFSLIMCLFPRVPFIRLYSR